MRDIDPDDLQQREIIAKWYEEAHYTHGPATVQLLKELKEHLTKPEPRYYVHPSNHCDIIKRGKMDSIFATSGTTKDAQIIVDALNAAEEAKNNAVKVDVSQNQAITPEQAKIGEVWFGGSSLWMKADKDRWLQFGSTYGHTTDRGMMGSRPYSAGDIK